MKNTKLYRYSNFPFNDGPLCIGNPGPPKLPGTRKIVQLTGDIDPETGQVTINPTGKLFKIYGTDLGVSFLHKGKLFFLFGDTNRGRPHAGGLPAEAMPGEDFNEPATDYDSIAWTTSNYAYDGINLIFNSDFPYVNSIDQMTGEHPVEGISIGEYMYVYFTTDLFPDEKVPTRTIWARSNDGGNYFGKPIYTLSTDKFIHVSAQIIESDRIHGLPNQTGKGLLIWGTGKHRKSDVCLAYMPLDKITDKSALRFFEGFSETSKPIWGLQESFAKPVFSAMCVGELSVRWNYYLGKWIILYNCDLCNTSGIIVRMVNNPWGPWSAPKLIFDPEDAYGKYIHKPGQANLHDSGRNGPDDWGDVYGPYQMTPYCTGIKGCYTKIYFTMSTWNPYQVLQMSAIISIDEETNSAQYDFNANDRNDRKYGYLSVLLAHFAKAKSIKLKSSIHASTYIADHIEWAQLHSHMELRQDLKNNFQELITNLIDDEDKSEAYAIITATITKLTNHSNSFDNTRYLKLKRWAANVIQSVQYELLFKDVNQRIDHEHFLPNDDYLCYAYGSEDANEFKYARLSVIMAKVADEVKMKWDFPYQGLLDSNSHIAWARFHSVDEMRNELINKFCQMGYKFKNADSLTNAFLKIIKAVSDVVATNSYFKNYSYHDLWITNKYNQESLIKEIIRIFNNDSLLVSILSY